MPEGRHNFPTRVAKVSVRVYQKIEVFPEAMKKKTAFRHLAKSGFLSYEFCFLLIQLLRQGLPLLLSCLSSRLRYRQLSFQLLVLPALP